MAESAIENWATRLSFALRQGSRVAWYAGHSAVMRRMVAQLEAKLPAAERARIEPPSVPVPNTRRLLADVGKLLARDLANVEAGIYPPPDDAEGGPAEMLAASRAFFRDVPEVARRRRQRAHQEVLAVVGPEAKRPRYYMQNFHFQSGGWMTDESARIYDMQVEVLFSGAANAMRRQALVPVAEQLKGRDQRTARFADLACGPGTFLVQARRAFPRLPTFAVDLSEAYLREAQRRLGRAPALIPVLAKCEALPLPDAALDVATAIFLFHELPPKIRRAAAREIARAITPGGLCVIVDSLQTGDEPDYDGLLELFPQIFHEPYYEGYLADPLESIFAAAGFAHEGTTNAFMAKVVRLRRV